MPEAGHSPHGPAPSDDQAERSPAHAGGPWIMGKPYSIWRDKVYFCSLRNIKPARIVQLEREHGCAFFCIDRELLYFPFCDDFGPLNMACIKRFSMAMKEKLARQDQDGRALVMYTGPEIEKRSNGACLLASWLVLELGWTAQRAGAAFRFTSNDFFAPFRDAGSGPVDFPLNAQHVLDSLQRAKELGLVDLETFDLEFYEYMDHPQCADLHCIVPNRFCAFKGPKDPRGTAPASELIDLTPESYLEVFKDLGVDAVVRLNSVEYDKAVFEAAGVAHYDLFFEDCTTPDEHILTCWFEICRRCPGMIAVHCKAGLGRTGTLIAAWLMRKYQFTAHEAIAYLRVMRPGSILGAQQQYLLHNQELFWWMGDPDLYNEDALYGISGGLGGLDEGGELAHEHSVLSVQGTEPRGSLADSSHDSSTTSFDPFPEGGDGVGRHALFREEVQAEEAARVAAENTEAMTRRAWTVAVYHRAQGIKRPLLANRCASLGEPPPAASAPPKVARRRSAPATVMTVEGRNRSLDEGVSFAQEGGWGRSDSLDDVFAEAAAVVHRDASRTGSSRTSCVTFTGTPLEQRRSSECLRRVSWVALADGGGGGGAGSVSPSASAYSTSPTRLASMASGASEDVMWGLSGEDSGSEAPEGCEDPDVLQGSLVSHTLLQLVSFAVGVFFRSRWRGGGGYSGVALSAAL